MEESQRLIKDQRLMYKKKSYFSDLLDQSETGKFKCYYCNLGLPTQQALTMHIGRFHYFENGVMTRKNAYQNL